MFAPSDRKRRVDSDSEVDQASKRPLLDNSTDTQDPTNATTMEYINQTDDQINNEIKSEAEDNLAAVVDDTVETLIPYQRLVLVNVEVTCDENPTNPAAVQVTKENAEIIQLSFAIVKSSTMEVLRQQTIHVRPERTPLTQFCTQITGVTSEMLSKAGTLEHAIQALDNAIETEIIDKGLNFCFVSHGGWVLRIQLLREARDKKIDIPSYIAHPCMFDLKQELQRWQLHHSDIHLRTTSIKELCNVFEIAMIGKDGTLLTASTDDTNKKVDDASISILATTVGIIRHLTSFRHDDVFVYPIDTAADLEQFNKEESKVVHLSGLPYEVTQGELEAWFSSNDLRPVTMWMVQVNEQMKPSLSGFVVFTQHDDAERALLLSGRYLNDRIIEISPSSERVVDVAYSILSPFPLQAKARKVRPGDWNCRNCSFHNFASRQNCFKCNAENPSNSTSIPDAPTGPAASSGGVGGDITAITSRGTPLSHAIVPSSSSSSSSSMSTTAPNTSIAVPTTTEATSSSVTSATEIATTSSTTAVAATPSTTTNATQSYPYSSGSGGPTSSFASGDWICTSCNFRNYSTRSQCMKCNTYRPNATGTPPSSTTPTAGTGPHSFPPRPHHLASFRPGDWFCPNTTCGFQNFASRMSCYRCQTSNPNPAPQPSYSGYDGSENTSPFYLGPGGYGPPNPAPGNMIAPGTGGHGFRAGDWYCPSCSSHNFASRFHCLKCRTAKPVNPSANPPAFGSAGYRGPPPIKSGDWVCGNPECGFHNFAKRTFCGRCNTPCPDPSYSMVDY